MNFLAYSFWVCLFVCLSVCLAMTRFTADRKILSAHRQTTPHHIVPEPGPLGWGSVGEWVGGDGGGGRMQVFYGGEVGRGEINWGF